MIANEEKVLAKLSEGRINFEKVRSIYISLARERAGRTGSAKKWIIDNGFELVGVPADQLLTDDGREIIRAYGKAWALKPEVHAQRLADAVEQAKQRDAAMAKRQPAQPTNPPTTCTTLIDGQLCGGTLIRAAVCPRCALGKMGVAATLTCDVCGHVTAIMQGGCNG